VKIKLHLKKGFPPPGNDELNTTIAVKHGVGHQRFANSFQNKKFL
jgi:hypothetical protein